MNYTALKSKVAKYLKIKQNTHDYRDQWKAGKKKLVIDTLQGIINNTNLEAEIDIKDDVDITWEEKKAGYKTHKISRKLLEKILTNPEVQNTLEKVLGENFLLRQMRF
mgnify:CR=1 FL=1